MIKDKPDEEARKAIEELTKLFVNLIRLREDIKVNEVDCARITRRGIPLFLVPFVLLAIGKVGGRESKLS